MDLDSNLRCVTLGKVITNSTKLQSSYMKMENKYTLRFSDA